VIIDNQVDLGCWVHQSAGATTKMNEFTQVLLVNETTAKCVLHPVKLNRTLTPSQ
jgi:hypothetical protein